MPDERSRRYRAEGLWDDRGLADGLEAAAADRAGALAVADNDGSLTYLPGQVRAVLVGDVSVDAVGTHPHPW